MKELDEFVKVEPAAIVTVLTTVLVPTLVVTLNPPSITTSSVLAGVHPQLKPPDEFDHVPMVAQLPVVIEYFVAEKVLTLLSRDNARASGRSRCFFMA